MDLEKTLLEKRAEFKEISSKVSGMLEKAPEMFRSSYEQIKEEEEKYVQMARDLEVSFSLHVKREDCENDLEQIDKNLEAMREKVVELMEHSEFETPEEAISAATQMKGYAVNARSVQDSQNELFGMVKGYSDEALFEIQKGFDARIQTIIRDTKLQLLAIKKQDLQDRRISLWGRLTGAGRLKEIELANLALEESILRKTPIKQKTAYNSQDILADLRAFVIKDLNNQDTIDTKSAFYSGLEVFGVSEAVIDEKAQRKLHSVPMVITDPKKKMKNSEKIEKANKRNLSLETELLEVMGSASKSQKEDSNEKVSEKFAGLLRDIVLRTSPEQAQTERAKTEEERAPEVMKEDKPKERDSNEIGVK